MFRLAWNVHSQLDICRPYLRFKCLDQATVGKGFLGGKGGGDVVAFFFLYDYLCMFILLSVPFSYLFAWKQEKQVFGFNASLFHPNEFIDKIN